MSELFDQCTVHDVFMCDSGMNDACDDEWIACMKVQGKCLKLEIDSGARCNILSLET